MEKVQSHIQTVKDIIYGNDENASLKQAFVILDRVKDEVKSIREDQSLSGIGIAQKEREARERGAIDLAKMVRGYKQAITKELDQAEKAARAIIDKPDVKPPQTLISEFSGKYAELKAELAVFNTKTNADRLVELMSSVSDPYFANILKSEFAEYGPALRNHVDHIRLQTVYDRVKKVAESDARSSARTALQEIESLRKAMPVNSMIGLGIDSSIGSEYRGILRDHETFLHQRGE
ncbi:hypothetical protein GCM10023310_39680 [Paenibacillus vulneris]|uniref:LXG domain-containing protein n=1 Tax=Paenibacillus vulneris TaxID=1133364 RepID=A0ABW3ULS3_9BACL